MKPTKIFNFAQKFLTLLAKANYHEYSILDKNGEVIGYEFYTVRGSTVIQINNKSEGKNKLDIGKKWLRNQ
jgi:hypothetical protein